MRAEIRGDGKVKTQMDTHNELFLQSKHTIMLYKWLDIISGFIMLDIILGQARRGEAHSRTLLDVVLPHTS